MLQSPSTRRAWIEIADPQKQNNAPLAVALHPEGVDRNSAATNFDPPVPGVALHPEGVDRNVYL